MDRSIKRSEEIDAAHAKFHFMLKGKEHKLKINL